VALYPAENHKSDHRVSKLLRVQLQILISNQFAPANISEHSHVMTEPEAVPVLTVSIAVA